MKSTVGLERKAMSRARGTVTGTVAEGSSEAVLEGLTNENSRSFTVGEGGNFPSKPLLHT